MMEEDRSTIFTLIQKLKYFISSKLSAEPSSAIRCDGMEDNNYYLISVTSILKIPDRLQSQIVNGREDWLTDVEVLDLQFKEYIPEAPDNTAISTSLPLTVFDIQQTEEVITITKKEEETRAVVVEEEYKSQLPNILFSPGTNFMDSFSNNIAVKFSAIDNSEEHVETGGNNDANQYFENGKKVIEEHKFEIHEESTESSANLNPPVTNVNRGKRGKKRRLASPEKETQNIELVPADNVAKTENELKIVECPSTSRKTPRKRKSKADPGFGKRKGRKLFPCQHCDRVFNSQNNLNYHLPFHTTERPYACNKCNKTFKSEPVLRQHAFFHSGIKPFTCHICGNSFALKNTLTCHVRSHTGEKPYICHICGASYSRSQELKIHVQRHSGLTPYQCEYCPKAFATKHEIHAHTRIHTTELKFVCEVCGSKFRSQSILNTHANIHTGEKNYVCEVCNTGFATKGYLSKHLKTHKSKTQDFKCDECGRFYKSMNTYNKHKTVHHSNERPFKCEICDKTFKLSYVLQQHSKVHKPEKDYSCSYCEKQFTFKSSLHSHLRTHHQKQLDITAEADIQNIVIPVMTNL